MHHRITLVLLTLIIVSPTIPLASTWINIETIQRFGTLTINTYLTSINLDLRNGGIISSYTYRGYTISTSRYFGPGTIYSAVLYEIIPSPTPTGSPPPYWWPGEVFGSRASIRVVENTSYKLVVEIPIPISRTYNVKLYKRYTFYYDKPYFNIEYVFENRENRELKIDLSNTWYRGVSFSIEVATAFGGDAKDDFQVYGTIDGRFIVRQGYSSESPDVSPSKISFIALVSYINDYTIPQGIIVIPMEDTVKETYAVSFEQPGAGLENVPTSSVVRLEMKALSLAPRSNKSYMFRVYMGPLTSMFLQEIGLQRLVTEMLKRLLRIPTILSEYKQPPYTVTLTLNIDNRNLYPNATLRLYRVTEEGRLELVMNITLGLPTIKIDKPGLYKLELDPPTGFTVDGNHIYTRGYVDGKDMSKAVIPIYSDTSITLSFDIQPIVWISVIVVDENYYELGVVRQYPIYMEFKGSNGYHRVFNLTEPLYKIYLPLGSYEVVIRPLTVTDYRLTDIYLNNEFMLYRVYMNGTQVSLDFSTPTTYNLIIRYSSVRATTGNSTQLFILLASSLIVVAIIVIALIYYFLRGRRI